MSRKDEHRGSEEDATATKRNAPIKRDEVRILISQLSATNRAALIECFNHGVLQKYKGRWYGSLDSTPISGNTVANLGRDGLLVTTKDKQAGSAHLTERGERVARTLIEIAARQQANE